MTTFEKEYGQDFKITVSQDDQEIKIAHGQNAAIIRHVKTLKVWDVSTWVDSAKTWVESPDIPTIFEAFELAKKALLQCAEEVKEPTNTEKCDAIRKNAIESILDQFKQGKTLVRSEQAYIQNGDSGWDWVGRVSAEGDDITERDLSFHTYDTIGDDPDEEYVGKDIWSHIDDISTDCLCAVADNLYA